LKLPRDGIESDKGRPGGRPADYFVVRVARGPAWDESKRRREQAGWDEHAAFMDVLVAEGLVVLGGPLGDVDGEYTLLVVEAESEALIRARLADDPWAGIMLTISSMEPWTVWLRAPVRP
jgi:uncharacterized protein YciI